MSKISKTNKILLSIVIVIVAYIMLALSLVQDFGNILFNERLMFVSLVTAGIGVVLLVISIFSRK